jgi:hypothetical protein
MTNAERRALVGRLHGSLGVITAAADEINRLAGAILGEVVWHEIEARQHRNAADEAKEDGDDEGWLHNTEAGFHEVAADRLRAILIPPPPLEEPEVPF